MTHLISIIFIDQVLCLTHQQLILNHRQRRPVLKRVIDSIAEVVGNLSFRQKLEWNAQALALAKQLKKKVPSA